MVIKDHWSRRLHCAPGQSIEVCHAVSLCTLDIILRCAFSYSSDVQHERSEILLAKC